MGRMLSFYEEKIRIKENDKIENKLMYLLRIYWKIMDDLDIKNEGYDVKDWKYKNYEKLLMRLHEIDLNKSEYRMYFSELMEFYSNEIVKKYEGE